MTYLQINLFEESKELKKRNSPVKVKIGNKLDYLTITQISGDWIMIYCSLCQSNKITSKRWWYSKTMIKKEQKEEKIIYMNIYLIVDAVIMPLSMATPLIKEVKYINYMNVLKLLKIEQRQKIKNLI